MLNIYLRRQSSLHSARSKKIEEVYHSLFATNMNKTPEAVRSRSHVQPPSSISRTETAQYSGSEIRGFNVTLTGKLTCTTATTHVKGLVETWTVVLGIENCFKRYARNHS